MLGEPSQFAADVATVGPQTLRLVYTAPESEVTVTACLSGQGPRRGLGRARAGKGRAQSPRVRGWGGVVVVVVLLLLLLLLLTVSYLVRARVDTWDFALRVVGVQVGNFIYASFTSPGYPTGPETTSASLALPANGTKQARTAHAGRYRYWTARTSHDGRTVVARTEYSQGRTRTRPLAPQYPYLPLSPPLLPTFFATLASASVLLCSAAFASVYPLVSPRSR